MDSSCGHLSTVTAEALAPKKLPLMATTAPPAHVGLACGPAPQSTDWTAGAAMKTVTGYAAVSASSTSRLTFHGPRVPTAVAQRHTMVGPG